MYEVAKAIRRIRNILKRGLVRHSNYGHSQRYLQLQVEGGEPIGDIEHFEPFGFTSGPVSGAEAVVLAFNGNGSHSVALVVDDRRYKLEVNEGEVAIFNRHGDKVHIKDDRSIAITAALKVEINAPLVECSGTVTAKDFITHTGVSANNHDHDETNGVKTNKANPA